MSTKRDNAEEEAEEEIDSQFAHCEAIERLEVKSFGIPRYQMFYGAIYWRGPWSDEDSSSYSYSRRQAKEELFTFEPKCWKLPEKDFVWNEHFPRDHLLKEIRITSIELSKEQKAKLQKDKPNKKQKETKLSSAANNSEEEEENDMIEEEYGKEEEFEMVLDNETKLHIALVLKADQLEGKEKIVKGISISGLPGHGLEVKVRSKAAQLLFHKTEEHKKRLPATSPHEQAFWTLESYTGTDYTLRSRYFNSIMAKKGEFGRAHQAEPLPARGISGFLPRYGLSVLIHLVASAFNCPQDDANPIPIFRVPKLKADDHGFAMRKIFTTSCQEDENVVKYKRKITEDRIYVDENADEGSGLILAAIFDGHGGGQVSDFASKEVKQIFFQHFRDYMKMPTPLARVQIIRECLRKTFASLEYECFVRVNEHRPKWDRMDFETTPQSSGACALVVIFDSKSGEVHCANAGDCFCFMVSGKVFSSLDDIKFQRLSTDHAGISNDHEVARVFASGGYCDVYNRWRTMGNFMPSRSLGDVDFKLSCPEFHSSYIAAPELEYVKLDPALCNIIVLSTDGFAYPGGGYYEPEVKRQIRALYFNKRINETGFKASCRTFFKAMPEGPRGDFDPVDDQSLILIGYFPSE